MQNVMKSYATNGWNPRKSDEILDLNEPSSTGFENTAVPGVKPAKSNLGIKKPAISGFGVMGSAFPKISP